jgi:hypothetical protein
MLWVYWRQRASGPVWDILEHLEARLAQGQREVVRHPEELGEVHPIGTAAGNGAAIIPSPLSSQHSRGSTRDPEKVHPKPLQKKC